MQPLEGAGVLPLKEQEVLLGTVQLVLQVCGCHADIQMACGKHRPWWLSLTARVAGGRLEEGAACCLPSLALGGGRQHEAWLWRQKGYIKPGFPDSKS